MWCNIIGFSFVASNKYESSSHLVLMGCWPAFCGHVQNVWKDLFSFVIKLFSRFFHESCFYPFFTSNRLAASFCEPIDSKCIDWKSICNRDWLSLKYNFLDSFCNANGGRDSNSEFWRHERNALVGSKVWIFWMFCMLSEWRLSVA